MAQDSGERVLAVFYEDNSPSSREARCLLDRAGIDYQTIFVNDPNLEGKIVPQLLASQGIFPSLELIRWYVNAYGRNKPNIVKDIVN